VVNAAGLLAKLSVPKVPEPVVNCSNDPPAYEGRITLDPILLDRTLFCARLETGGYKLVFNWTHSNLVFHHMGGALHETALLLREATAMVGRPYRPLSGGEISLSNLTFAAMPGSTLIDCAEDVEERRSHSDPDQADTGDAVTSD
jgi:hypothetical protein